ncbi:MAG: DHH family phosphoesterase [Lachnospiraceae bacterium]|nr:DHH family phosphoesterase [Lachnospiraceae bacterium]
MDKTIRLRGRLKQYIKFTLYLGILLLLVNIAIYLLDVRAGVLLSAFVLFYFVITLWLTAVNKRIVTRELINFATEYGQVQRTMIKEFDVPYALLEENGKIVWCNDSFLEVVGGAYPRNVQIHNLFPAITKDKFPDRELGESVDVSFTYEEKEYRARISRMIFSEMLDQEIELEEYAENAESYLLSVFLYDETALKYAIRQVDDQSLAICLIYLDNYDEALGSLEEVRRSLLVALIDRKVNKYISAVDGICRKLEKDKYFVILRKKNIKQLQEMKFDLLEDVKTVSIGNEMAVTVSIGVGYDGLSYAQNYEFARNAIDLALGRGGDQAVVRAGSEILYFGGKSQKVEKNTRVKARVKAHALKEIISSKDQVLVMGHRLPDVDSFGAAVGICRIAKICGKEAHVVLNDVSGSLQPMTSLFADRTEYPEDFILSPKDALECVTANTVLVVVDVNRPAITECPDLLRMCKNVVVIDHHRQSTDTVENATLSYIEPYASSTSEMVSEILQYTADNLRIRPEEADCLYAGIVIDTNNFLTKTGVRTFEAAAYLRRNGADVTRVRKMFLENAIDYKTKADAVSQAEIYRGDYAISYCQAEEVANPTVIGAQAANELLNIKGVKASFVLTPFQGKIYISARSIDEVNVQVIMERMGGGGHLNVAACQMENATLAEAEGALKGTLDTMIEEGDLL